MPTDPPKPTQLYLARVSRLRIETAFVEVWADSLEAAEREVISTSQSPTVDWRCDPFDYADYEAWIEEIHSERSLETDGFSSYSEGKQFVMDNELDDCRYAILKGDLGIGEGQVLMQPWFSDVDVVMRGDLIHGWRHQLQVSDVLPDSSPDNVVEFRRREPDDPPDDPSAA